MSEAPKLEATIVPPESIARSDRRRDWALLITSGGAMAMTLFAVACLWVVRERADFVFYLGLAAMAQIFMVFTGLMGLLVKRNLKISKDEISVSDMTDNGEYIGDDVISREKAEKAIEKVPPIKKAGIEQEATGVPSDDPNLKS